MEALDNISQRYAACSRVTIANLLRSSAYPVAIYARIGMGGTIVPSGAIGCPEFGCGCYVGMKKGDVKDISF